MAGSDPDWATAVWTTMIITRLATSILRNAFITRLLLSVVPKLPSD